MALPIVEGVEFRAIEGWPGYAVGDDGTVWSCKKKGTVGLGSWRALRQTADARGYKRINLREKPRTLMAKVHRLVLEAFTGHCPVGMVVTHMNDIPSDNRLVNLKWDTQKNNMRQMVERNRHPKGERSNRGHITAENVIGIRQLSASGKGTEWIAREFGISSVQVWRIVSRKQWRHIA